MAKIELIKGRTPKYPLQQPGGKSLFIQGEESFNQRVLFLLTTRKGSVFGNRTFGSRLHEIKALPPTGIFSQLADNLVTEAIKDNIPNVSRVETSVKHTEEGLALLSVSVFLNSGVSETQILIDSLL